MGIRIHEASKKFNVSNKQLVDVLTSLGYTGKTIAVAGLADEWVVKLEKHFAAKSAPVEPKKENKPVQAQQPKVQVVKPAQPQQNPQTPKQENKPLRISRILTRTGQTTRTRIKIVTRTSRTTRIVTRISSSRTNRTIITTVIRNRDSRIKVRNSRISETTIRARARTITSSSLILVNLTEILAERILKTSRTTEIKTAEIAISMILNSLNATTVQMTV